MSWTGFDWTNRHPRFVVDLTGDGRGDIVGFGDDGVYVALGNGGGTLRWAAGAGNFGYDQGWRIDEHPRFVTDITGNGRPDVVEFGNDGVFVALSNGDGSFQPAQFALADFAPNAHSWHADRNPRRPADLTGDGRADIVGFGDDDVSVALSNGDGSFQQPVWGCGDLTCFRTVGSR
jgi:FG-GAP-like repeat